MGRNMGEHKNVKSIILNSEFIQIHGPLNVIRLKRMFTHECVAIYRLRHLWDSILSVCGSRAKSDFQFRTSHKAKWIRRVNEKTTKINKLIWNVVSFSPLATRKMREYKKWTDQKQRENKSIETNLVDPPSLSSLFTFRIHVHFVLHFFLCSSFSPFYYYYSILVVDERREIFW